MKSQTTPIPVCLRHVCLIVDLVHVVPNAHQHVALLAAEGEAMWRGVESDHAHLRVHLVPDFDGAVVAAARK